MADRVSVYHEARAATRIPLTASGVRVGAAQLLRTRVGLKLLLSYIRMKMFATYATKLFSHVYNPLRPPGDAAPRAAYGCRIPMDSARAACRRRAKGRSEEHGPRNPIIPRTRTKKLRVVNGFAAWSPNGTGWPISRQSRSPSCRTPGCQPRTGSGNKPRPGMWPLPRACAASSASGVPGRTCL